eukprot:2647145-Prorocentrum_lima.AAC.1
MPPSNAPGLLPPKGTCCLHVGLRHVAGTANLLQHLRPALKSPSRMHPHETPRPDPVHSATP